MKNYSHIYQYSQSPGQDMKPGPTEYKAGVLKTRLRLVPLV
jgi:hypothetical protein